MQAVYASVGAAYGAVSLERWVRDQIDGATSISVPEEHVANMLELVLDKSRAISENLESARSIHGLPAATQMKNEVDSLRRRAQALSGRGEPWVEHAERARNDLIRAERAAYRVDVALRLAQAVAIWGDLAVLQVRLTCTDAHHGLYSRWWRRLGFPPTNRGDLELSVLETLAYWGPTVEDNLTPGDVVDFLEAATPYVLYSHILLDPPFPHDVFTDSGDIVHENCRTGM